MVLLRKIMPVYGFINFPMNKIALLWASWITKMKGRLHLNSSGGGEKTAMRFIMTTAVAASASVPSSFTSTTL